MCTPLSPSSNGLNSIITVLLALVLNNLRRLICHYTKKPIQLTSRDNFSAFRNTLKADFLPPRLLLHFFSFSFFFHFLHLFFSPTQLLSSFFLLLSPSKDFFHFFFKFLVYLLFFSLLSLQLFSFSLSPLSVCLSFCLSLSVCLSLSLFPTSYLVRFTKMVFGSRAIFMSGSNERSGFFLWWIQSYAESTRYLQCICGKR